MNTKHIPDGEYTFQELADFYKVSKGRINLIACRGEFSKYFFKKKGCGTPNNSLVINTESRSNLEFWINKTQRKRKKDDKTAITTG